MDFLHNLSSYTVVALFLCLFLIFVQSGQFFFKLSCESPLEYNTMDNQEGGVCVCVWAVGGDAGHYTTSVHSTFQLDSRLEKW